MKNNKEILVTQKTTDYLQRLAKVECPDTTFFGDGFPIVMKKGKGMVVTDVDNRHYSDFTACFGVLALGHTPTVVRHALQKQMKRLIHGMGDVHPTEEKIKLLELLAEISPYDNAKSLLGLSGGDAVEAALKTAMLATSRSQFLSFDGGYHGLQFAPLALNHRPVFTQGFEAWCQGKSVSLPFPNGDEEKVLERLEDELKKKTFAALVLEPIQARGGKREFSQTFLRSCLELCKKYGTLLIFDEVYTGFGRTGTMFALEHFKVTPDLLCVGKALGGGLPLSACVGEILDVWGKSQGEARHTQTFLGHPLACAVAYKNVKEIGKRLPEFQAELFSIEKEFERFIILMKKLGLYERYPVTLRGRGFMRGLWFYTQPAGFCVTLMEMLLKQGFIVLPEGELADVLSLTPPLIAKAVDYRKILNAVVSVLKEI